MSDPAPARLLPRGLIGASLLAAVLAGPLWFLCSEAAIAVATAIARRWPAAQPALGVDLQAANATNPIEVVLVPLLSAPLSVPAALMTAWPPTVLLLAMAFAFFPDRRWPKLRRTWLAAGAALGAVIGPHVLAMWYGPPVAGYDDGATMAVAGALDGLCCALAAHRFAAKRGAFDGGQAAR